MIGLGATRGQVQFDEPYEITDANGRNITPSMHHDTHVHMGSIIAPAAGLFYVSFVAWAASSSAVTNITVDRTTGIWRSSVLVGSSALCYLDAYLSNATSVSR